MKITNARVFTENFCFVSGELAFEGELLCSQSSDSQTIDAGGKMIIPGLVDVHLHGCMGVDFCDGTVEAFDTMTAYEGKNGVTAITPASMTLPVDQLENVYRTAGAYRYNGGAMLCGINMEGPFFAEKKKGAQNGAYLRAPDAPLFDRLNNASGGMVRIACIAPELEGSMPYIAYASGKAAVSIAHTESDYDTAICAFESGASHVTHLYNAMQPFSHRAPGVIGAAADKGATVELISDGVHIHPSVVRATFKLFGDDKVVLISDSMMATGLQDGNYSLGGQDVLVCGNRCTLSDGTIAGSATNLFDCMRTAVKFGIPLESAVKAASFNPARVIGESARMGSLTIGKLANFVILNDDLSIDAVYVKGQKL